MNAANWMGIRQHLDTFSRDLSRDQGQVVAEKAHELVPKLEHGINKKCLARKRNCN